MPPAIVMIRPGDHLPVTRAFGTISLGAVALIALLDSAAAAELVSYRASYSLALASTHASSGVVGARGLMREEWNETCDGWTDQEHFYLHLDYGEPDAERDSLDTYSSFVSWEAKDGRHYRFDMRQASTDKPYDEVKGDASLAGSGEGGTAEFTRPEATVLALPRGTIFPAAHTRLLIDRAQAGDQMVTRHVFDGTELDRGDQITAAIMHEHGGGAVTDDEPLLPGLSPNHASWQIALAFFPTGSADETPDYEETVRLLDNGVMQEMLFDYGDYTIRAKLDQIELLPRPRC